MLYPGKRDSSKALGSSQALVRSESRRSAVPPRPDGSQYFYTLYGLALRSDTPLALEEQEPVVNAAIEIRTEPASFFAGALRGASFEDGLSDWYQYARLEDRSSYIRWRGLGEFVVSNDGRRLYCNRFEGALSESFQVYLLNRALSFALVKQGLEPFHATAIVVDGEAIAFLGRSGFGKSSLAASFLAIGHQLLTDDLLLLRRSANRVMAYPGPPRIKLYRAMANRFLSAGAAGVPMNAETRKLVISLSGGQVCSGPVPIKTIYVLQSPRESWRNQAIRIIELDPRQAFLELLKNTFNFLHIAPERLQRQFGDASGLANTVRFAKLSHPRVVGKLTAVRDAILADAGSAREEMACRA